MRGSFQAARTATLAKQRRLAWFTVVLPALCFPATAHPFSIEQLLSLPLERLLQLEIAPRRSVGTGMQAIRLSMGPTGGREAR